MIIKASITFCAGIAVPEKTTWLQPSGLVAAIGPTGISEPGKVSTDLANKDELNKEQNEKSLVDFPAQPEKDSRAMNLIQDRAAIHPPQGRDQSPKPKVKVRRKAHFRATAYRSVGHQVKK